MISACVREMYLDFDFNIGLILSARLEYSKNKKQQQQQQQQ